MTAMRIPTSISACMLRPFRPGDRDGLVFHANNHNVWRNLTDAFPRPYTATDAEYWIRMTAEPAGGLHFAIVWNDAVIGSIGADAMKNGAAGTAHFGYWLGETYWGKGIASAAARAFLDHIERNGPFACLQATVFGWKHASMRVLEKTGFRRVQVMPGAITKDGEVTDNVIYARRLHPLPADPQTERTS